MKYVIVIPAKDEQKNIADTLQSVAEQALLPEACLVVDDNSSDDTSKIVNTFSEKYSFIKYYKNLSPKNSYALGGHVVEVFNIGLKQLDEMGVEFDYAIKMDADITFEPDCIDKLFSKNEVIEHGIFSATPYYMHNGKKILDYSPHWHAHGQFKIYNIKCLHEIGGIPLSLGWDTADNIKAMSRGWKTQAYRDVFYKMHRKVGGKSSLKKGRINHGIGAYVLGYSFTYFTIKVLHDILRPPVVLGALNMLIGYLKAFFGENEVILEKDEKRLLRKLLWQSFFIRFKNKDFVVFQLFKSKG